MNGGSPSPYITKVNALQYPLWKNRWPLLEHLDIELTERCNNDCIHCCVSLPADDTAARQRELKTAEVKAILAEAAALGALSVCFTGGEPLMREDFEELYLFSRQLGLKVILFTNARLITPELADIFVSIPPLEKIEVTVYGMKRESYEAVSRVRGAYAEFRRGLDLLLEQKIPFMVKGALLPPNREEVDALEAWAATIPTMDKPPRFSMFFDLRYRRDSSVRNRLIKHLRISPDDGLAVLMRGRDAYLKEMRDFCSKFMGPPGDRLFSCGAGHMCCVDAYGVLQPCLPLRHPNTVYNLKTGSLKDALTTFFPRLRETKSTNPDYLARCARCFLKGLCDQCPAKSWIEHGTLDTPVEYLCHVAHAKARDLNLLKKGERAWEVTEWRKRVKEFCEKENASRNA